MLRGNGRFSRPPWKEARVITSPVLPQDNTSVSVRAHTVREPLSLARMVRILLRRPDGIHGGRSWRIGSQVARVACDIKRADGQEAALVNQWYRRPANNGSAP